MRAVSSRGPLDRTLRGTEGFDKLKFLRFWFPVLVYSGIIFYASSLPDVKSPLDIPNLDKVVHILEYLPFGFLLARALTRQNTAVGPVAAICSLLYGLSDEYHQSFVPGREAGLTDVVADTIGGFLGASIYLYFSANRNKTKAKIS